MKRFLILAFAIFSAENCDGGNVLFLPAMTSSSHKLALSAWADALAERGHHVYWWAPAARVDKYQPKEKSVHVDHYEVDVDDPEAMEIFRYENSTMMTGFWWHQDTLPPAAETTMMYLLTPFCEKVITEHKESLNRVLSRKYDLIIVDEYFNPCAFLVTQMLHAPVASFLSMCKSSRTSNKHNGVAVPHSYTPHLGIARSSDDMSFLQRVFSTLIWGLAHVGDTVYFHLATGVLRKHYPDLAPLETSLVQPQLQFLCVPSQLDTLQPIARNLVHVGGIQIPKTLSPLTAEYQSMVDGAKKGFVVVALGHWANWLLAPERFRKAFIEAFSRIPEDYVIIWQYNGHPIPDLPKHIKPVKWVPQQSLLANPKCVLFITHVGCNSLTEAVYYGVPMIGIPLSAEQPDNAVKISKMGLGFHLNKLTFSTDTLYDAMWKVLTDKTYERKIKKLSEVIKNDTLTAMERAVFWSEFAMKHGKKEQYRSWFNVVNLSTFKYHCLDIITFSLLILFFSMYCLITVTKLVCFKLSQ